jgi:hypothetical protein
MKKLLTIALAIICMAVLTGLAAGQGHVTVRKPKPPRPPETARNSAHATEQLMTGTVTKWNDKAQTFTVTANGKEVLFSGKNLKPPFPKVGDFVDVTYTPPPKPDDPPAATTVKGSKSNGSFRVASPPPTKMVTGTVTNVDEKRQNFTVKTDKGEQFTFTFSAKQMPEPKKGDQVAVTYIQKTPSNLDDRRIPVYTPERISLIQGLDNPQALSITIYFGKARCAPGFGICRIDIGAAGERFEVALGHPDTATRARPRTGQASVSVEQDKTAKGENVRVRYFMGIIMKTALPENGSVLPISENITLDAATAKALGFKSVTVLRGEYKIDYSKNKLGSVVVNVEVHN